MFRNLTKRQGATRIAPSEEGSKSITISIPQDDDDRKIRERRQKRVCILPRQLRSAKQHANKSILLALCLLCALVWYHQRHPTFSWRTTSEEDLPYLASSDPPRLLLARSIGNALPPRQDKNQSLRNLEFVLLHEPHFPNVDRHWILNRIIDPQVEDELISFLESHKESYSRLPFNLTLYSETPYVFSNHNPGDSDILHSKRFPKLQEKERLILLDATQDKKSLYTTNVNGARNFMIDFGRKQTNADYILPWDGNCFLTEAAYESIGKAIKKHPHDRYFVTPMDRVKGSNDVLLDPSYKPNAIEEPQVIFHRSARARFDPFLRYGRRNKVELLIRLQVPGKWTKWKWESWEKQYRVPRRVEDMTTTKVPTAGWVARLFSGNARLEQKNQLVQRGVARSESLTRLFHTLDLRAATELYGWSRETYMYYDRKVLQQERHGSGAVKSVRNQLITLAQDAMQHGPWTVMDKKPHGCGLSGDCHDYYHPTPYFWPQTNRATGEVDLSLPFKKRDGIRRPGTVLYSDESDEFDRTRLAAMQFNTTVLALAYSMTGEQKFANKAADNIRTWFVTPETKMAPHLNYAQVKWQGSDAENGGTPSGVIEWKDLYFFLDAVRMVEESGELNEADQQSLREWFQEYLQWMLTSEMAQKEYREPNNHGLYFDIQLIALASYTGNLTVALETIHQSIARLEGHIELSGRMPQEMKRPTCEHYQMFTLQGWTTLARLSARVGLNLWTKDVAIAENPKDSSLWAILYRQSSQELNKHPQSALCRAMEYSVPFLRNRPPCPKNVQDEDDQRWWPLWLEAQHNCPNLNITKGSFVSPEWLNPDSTPPPTSQYGMKSRYYEHDGVAPFWNLGRFYQS